MVTDVLCVNEDVEKAGELYTKDGLPKFRNTTEIFLQACEMQCLKNAGYLFIINKCTYLYIVGLVGVAS